MKVYIVYEINLWPFNVDKDFALRNSLFRAVKVTENTHLGKYKYSDFGIGFETHGNFSLSNGSGCVKIVVMFGANRDSLAQILDSWKRSNRWFK